jgi:DNA-binding response OmpR family regulator
LPNAPARAARASRTTAAPSTTPASATILVIEDDAATGRLLSKILIAAGHDVVLAETGAEARARLGELTPDLILLDLILPDIDGLLLAVTLKQLTQAPIVVCSGRGGEVDQVLAARLGAVAFLVKPFNVDDLEGAIRRALAVARAQGDTAATT